MSWLKDWIYVIVILVSLAAIVLFWLAEGIFGGEKKDKPRSWEDN